MITRESGEGNADSLIGTRSRVPRPVRNHKLSRCSMDDHPARCSWCYLRMAAVAFAGILHQAETYLGFGGSRGLGEKRGARGSIPRAAGRVSALGCRIWRYRHGSMDLAFDMTSRFWRVICLSTDSGRALIYEANLCESVQDLSKQRKLPICDSNGPSAKTLQHLIAKAFTRERYLQ
jgi:hypothetical protein